MITDLRDDRTHAAGLGLQGGAQGRPAMRAQPPDAEEKKMALFATGGHLGTEFWRGFSAGHHA